MMASANFESSDRYSWYFGPISRKDAQDRLLHQKHGTFLVRDSSTCVGDYVLSVSENSKVSHYIVNKSHKTLKIGDQVFSTMPELLDFYKVHYLDTTTLIEPISKGAAPSNEKKHMSYSAGMPSASQQSLSPPPGDGLPSKQNASLQILVRGLFDFKSDDPDDLPFSKGEILEVIEKPEENWWNARNSQGRVGQIPVPYIEMHVTNRHPTSGHYSRLQDDFGGDLAHRRLSGTPLGAGPVHAKVITRRVPNAYDPTALALEVGDIIKVTKMNKNGQWEGECNNKKGWFPFTHVQVMEERMS